MRAVALSCAFALLGSGCFAVADLDRFEKRTDFVAHLSGFEAFAGERIHVQLINEEDVTDFVVAAHAVIFPLDADGDHVFVLPAAIPEGGDYGADTFVDLDEDGQHSPMEPLWRSELGDDNKLHLSASEMQREFLDPPTRSLGTGFEMRVRGMSVHTANTQYFELLVFDTTEGRPVGYYFLPDVDNQDFDVSIPGIIESGHEYEVDYYADANQSNCYEQPGGASDHTWRETEVGGSGEPGLEIEFIHHANFQRIPESFPDVRECSR